MPHTTPTMRPVWFDEDVEFGLARLVEVALDEAEVAGTAAKSPFSEDEIVAEVLDEGKSDVDVKNVLPVVLE